MQTFGDLVRAYLGAEDVDSTIVDYLVNVAADVHDESMTIEDYVDLVLQMMPDSRLNSSGRDVAAICFGDLLEEARSSAQGAGRPPDGSISGSAGDGSDPDWLSELMLRNRSCPHTAVDSTQESAPDGRQRLLSDISMLSEVTGNCLEAAFLEHILCRAGGNVQAAVCWLMEQEDVPQLQCEWQEGTQKNASIDREETAEIKEHQNIKKSIVRQFAFAEEKPRGTSRCAAMPWGHTKYAESADPPQVRYRDGMKVTSRGEKHIIVSKPEWDGGSRGKVYTKGKRGKGFS